MSTLALPVQNGSARQHGLSLPMPTASPSVPIPSLPNTNSSIPNPATSSNSNNNATASQAEGSRRALANMPGNRSPSIELKEIGEGDDEDGDEDDDEEGGSGRKKKSGGAVGGKGGKKMGGEKGEYKYSSEISQMMFVFGEVQDPLAETVRLVEDIVRGQIIEIVTRARLLTHLRSSRYLSAEDLIFLIRDDRGKVNRLRTYLSWKDVRKRAKEDEDGDVEVDEADKAAPKGRKSMVKLPWELLTPFGDFLRGLPSKQGRNEDEEEEDEDEIQAYHDSMQRLKDADEITKKMTKDEYVHYSDCRQASFTYRKARRFRDFVNFGAYLDVRPNDDIVDVLGFLSFEMVRSLCVTALEVRDRLDRPSIVSSNTRKQTRPGSPTKRKLTAVDNNPSLSHSPSKKVKDNGVVVTTTMVTSPEPVTPANQPASTDQQGGGTGRKAPTGTAGSNGVSLFAPPPSARQPLSPAHVLEAFAQIQRQQAANRTKGLGNWRGGTVGRGRVALV